MTNYVWHIWREGWRKTKIDVRIRAGNFTATDSYLIIIVTSRRWYTGGDSGVGGGTAWQVIKDLNEKDIKLILIIAALNKCTFRLIPSCTTISQGHFPE